MKKALITGSAGLVGSESAYFFAESGFEIHGIDNDLRKYFFGNDASTKGNKKKLDKKLKDKYIHHSFDIRNKKKLDEIFKNTNFDLIIHTAAQPSHDWAAKQPYVDFEVNALATLNLLENYRIYSPNAVFIFTSTNKVYGDRPNLLPLKETDTRYELDKNHPYFKGINENMSIDQCKHSLFGVSKIAADVMVQEYGKYFGLKTNVFRSGCLTGPAHAGTRLHGFLSYLIKCIYNEKPYTIYGYKGKQVRDNLHSYDLVQAFYQVYKKPLKGEVYNMGGSRFSNTSILEAIKKIEIILNKKAKIIYNDENRIGDHIWYISDVTKFKKNYPNWKHVYDNDMIIEEICSQF